MNIVSDPLTNSENRAPDNGECLSERMNHVHHVLAEFIVDLYITHWGFSFSEIVIQDVSSLYGLLVRVWHKPYSGPDLHLLFLFLLSYLWDLGFDPTPICTATRICLSGKLRLLNVNNKYEKQKCS